MRRKWMDSSIWNLFVLNRTVNCTEVKSQHVRQDYSVVWHSSWWCFVLELAQCIDTVAAGNRGCYMELILQTEKWGKNL
jgi:hypothetical protein